jgi:signal transduction histidine kinase/CheY-like chemotaxis protein/ligand-binding sensor domain-containing protein
MKIKALILLFLLCFTEIFAQEYLFEAQNITPEDGLSNLMTTTIFKDQQGFLWISTQHGLNQYDGHTFQQYTAKKNGLFTNEHIRKIAEDGDGNLWLFHSFSLKEDTSVSEIDIFDLKSKQAIPFNQYFKEKAPFDASEAIVLKVKDPKKRIWLANKKGQIFLYQKNGFKKIIEREGVIFNTLTIDKEDHIWLSVKNQLICIDTLGNVLESRNLPEAIESVFIGDKKEIWVVTTIGKHLLKKITIWSKEENSTDFEELVLTKKGHSLLHGHQAVRCSNGLWYVMINSHFELFDEEGAWLFEFNSLFEKDIQTDINDYLEIGNSVWFTTPLGIVKTSIKPNLFQLIHRKETLSDCRNIVEGENGNIYFLNGHLYQWNKSIESVRQVSESPNNIGLVYKDSTLFAGFYDLRTIGSHIDLRTKKETPIPNLNSAYYQLTTLIHLQNDLYLVAQVKGLGYLDLSRKEYLTFDKYNSFERLKEAKIYYCHKNAEGIWIATSIGIFFMTEEEGVLSHFDTESSDLPFNRIRHIYEDEEGVFWLATEGGGIVKWDQKNPQNNRQFTTVDGLSNNYLYAIYEDDFDRLWISSDKGLMCMHKESYEIKTYLIDDGLPHNEFNQTAHYKGKDGVLYFGGLGGLVAFHPKDFRGNIGKDIPLEFTKFYILEDEKEGITNNTALLQENNEIVIQPEDKFFEVHFTLLDFESPDNHRYSYQIEGYSSHWTQIKENYIRITNLPSGEYVLRVKGQNRQKGWSNQELVLKIKILKPFYLKMWFNIFVLTLVIVIGLIIIRWRGYQSRKRQRHLEQQVTERTQTIQEQAEKMEQLDKVKTRFFSNITHEFRTPLTLILGPLEQLIEETPTIKVNEKLSGVLKNAKHLLTLINQMLDLSKIESGEMRVALSRGDIVDYTEELTKRFQSLAEKKEQKLTFISYKDHWETNFDKAKWDKIIYNLLSNALKFTPSGNAIQLCIACVKEEGKEFIRLDVKDTGQGIEAQHLGQIFNHFYQIDYSNTREQEGTGIGLALVKELVELQNGTISVSSELHKGTSFEVQLPVLDLKEGVSSEIKLVVEPILIPAPTISVVPLNKGEKLELLLIEDNVEMRNYIISCIDLSRYNVTEASNGEEGIEKAQKFIPDLIVSDVMMPKKDGFEVVEIIRSHISTSHIPFIFLTAKTVLENRLKGLSKGADAYLTKPFSPQELCLRIEKLIESRSLLQQRYKGHTELAETENLVSEEEDPFIAELKTYIFDHINEPDLSGDRIGKHFLISRVHLHRKLKALTNQPISDFVRGIRLKKALELIKEGKLNVSEIAYQTGFSSVSHFSRSFKKAYGKAPSKM